MKKYSREDEANLPSFSSHDEARKYFKEKHGSNFQMIDSEVINGQKYYFYNLILDEKAYNNGMEELTEKGYTSGLELMNSYQKIEIREDGFVHMIH